jgi:beta-N-acetylhexosaminidase
MSPGAPRTAVAALAVTGALVLAACGGSGGSGVRRVPQPGTSSASAHGSSDGGVATSAPPPSPSPSPTCSNASRLAAWPDRRLAMLTIAVPVAETSVESVASEVADGAGGVVLFGSYAPRDLAGRLAALRARVPGRSGLLVMTDEEGGGVQRMANLVGSLPWAASMGANWSPQQIRQAVAQVGAKMAAAGVNMDLAPVADVDGSDVPPSSADPDGWRSFSGSTATVTQDIAAYVQGLRSAGVIPVLKHFPGLGGASGNTDDGSATTPSWAEERSRALPPFTAGLAAGAPAVMLSNAIVPGLTSGPAGLSSAVVTGELRRALNFHGLAITDALDAKAVSAAGYDLPQASVQALRAGADMVMFGLDGGDVANRTAETASAIVNAVGDGSLPRARLLDAASAVLAVRNVDLCAS